MLRPVPIGVAVDDLHEWLARRPRESPGLVQVGVLGALDRAHEVGPGNGLARPKVGGRAAPALLEDPRIAGVEVEGLVRRVRVAPLAQGGDDLAGVAFPPFDVRDDVPPGPLALGGEGEVGVREAVDDLPQPVVVDPQRRDELVLVHLDSMARRASDLNPRRGSRPVDSGSR